MSQLTGDDPHRRLTTTELQAVATYRQMIDWLSTLPDDEYERQMESPIAVNLAAFAHFRLRQKHQQFIDSFVVSLFPDRGNQTAFLGAEVAFA